MKKELGKIQRAEFGLGGYQDAQIGISFTLSGDGWGVGDFWGFWAGKRGPGAQWSEEDRIKSLGKTVMRLDSLLSDAKKNNVSQLVGVPIEANFENNTLKTWRILKEVL